MARFLSDVRLREPGMFVRGPEEMLETLRKERPGKRVLRLRGIYYYDSRIFTLSGLDHVRETEKKQF
jgi:hypothetical protein